MGYSIKKKSVKNIFEYDEFEKKTLVKTNYLNYFSLSEQKKTQDNLKGRLEFSSNYLS